LVRGLNGRLIGYFSDLSVFVVYAKFLFFYQGPAAKRQKQSDSSGEDDYLRTYTGPVTFKVQVPHVADKPEWSLNGQVMTLSLGARDSMTLLKNKIQEQLGIPLAKQKVQFEGVCVKDNQTMVACNIVPGSVVFLQVKERGGRKKN